jgi:hypothetical protein
MEEGHFMEFPTPFHGVSHENYYKGPDQISGRVRYTWTTSLCNELVYLLAHLGSKVKKNRGRPP